MYLAGQDFFCYSAGLRSFLNNRSQDPSPMVFWLRLLGVLDQIFGILSWVCRRFVFFSHKVATQNQFFLPTAFFGHTRKVPSHYFPRTDWVPGPDFSENNTEEFKFLQRASRTQQFSPELHILLQTHINGLECLYIFLRRPKDKAGTWPLK